MKKIFLLTAFFIVIAAFIVFQEKNPAPQSSKLINSCPNCNLILISVDTLREDHLGIYGYSKNTTKNIDSWAKDSTVFTNVYTVLPLTEHSFFTLFTGTDRVLLDPSLSQAYPTSMNAYKGDTLAKILKKNNYDTQAFLTSMVPGTLFKDFFSIGFNNFNFVNTSKLKDDDPMLHLNAYQDQIAMTSKSIDWLSSNRNKKFFLWLHYLNPHHPYNAPKSYLCKIDLSCDKSFYHDTLRGDDKPEACITKLSDEVKQRQENLYDAEILTTDEQIGRVINKLKDLKLEKNTMVVFYADHGEGFDHDMYHHGNSLYSSNIRIPLIINVPGSSSNKITSLIDNSDILPSILDILGVKHDKANFTGKSFEKALLKKNNNDKGKDYVYFITPPDNTHRLGITDGRYKYMVNQGTYCFYNDYRQELYDLEKDPGETDNIIDQEPEITNRLKEELIKKLSGVYASPAVNNVHTQEEGEIIKSLKSLGY